MGSNISLQVLECGVTAMDFEMVAVGHPDKNASKHLSCGHPRLREGQIAHPVYAYIIDHPVGGSSLILGLAIRLNVTGRITTTLKRWTTNLGTTAFSPNA